MADQDRTATEWITAFASALGVDPPDDATITSLLDIAGVAAHASERTAAPIACWLIGRADLPMASARRLADSI